MIIGQDFSLWQALLQSETFWSETVFWFGVALLMAAGMVALVYVRRRVLLPRLARDVSGSANAIEFTLVAPVFLIFFSIVIQIGLFATDSLTVHYAAYAAARSARVHACPSKGEVVGDVLAGDSIAEGFAGSAREWMLFKTCTGSPGQSGQRWEYAARMALIAAAPSSERVRFCQSNCKVPTSVLQRIAGVAGGSAFNDVILRKAEYAFDARNVEVELESSLAAQLVKISGASTLQALPATATVRYRHLIVLPMAIFFRDEKDSDGASYRWATATVTVL